MCLSEEHLEQYLLGRLPEPDAERAEDHLVLCTKCQDHAEVIKQGIDFIKAGLVEHSKRSSIGLAAVD
jgi:anti-sigma factor RsiW